MLIYEKKLITVDGEEIEFDPTAIYTDEELETVTRKLFGTLANVPSDEDEEITVSGGTFEIDDKGRVLIPKESDEESEEEDDEEDDAEAEEEKDIVKLVYGNSKKMQFSVSGIPDSANDAEITVAIIDKDGGEVTIIPNTDTDSKYQLTLEASPAEGGTVEGAGKYEEGEEVTISATANEGYAFVEWGDGDTNASRTYIMPGSASTLTATFEAVSKKTSYTVHYYESGTTTPLHEDKEVSDMDVGTVVTENAVTAEGYTPDAASKEITLVEDASSNVITFEYTNNQPEQ